MRIQAGILFTLFIFFALVCSPVWAVDADFEQKVRSSGLLKDSDEVLVKTNVYFYEGKKGFSVFSGGKERVQAYFILTQDALMVVDWNRRKDIYELIYRDGYSDLTNVDIAGGSFAVRLVTEDKSGNFNSFELVDGRNALGTDPEITREAKTIIAAGIQGYDVEAVAAANNPSPGDVLQQKQTVESMEERLARIEALLAAQAAGNKAAVQQEAPAEVKNTPGCSCVCPTQE